MKTIATDRRTRSARPRVVRERLIHPTSENACLLPCGFRTDREERQALLDWVASGLPELVSLVEEERASGREPRVVAALFVDAWRWEAATCYPHRLSSPEGSALASKRWVAFAAEVNALGDAGKAAAVEASAARLVLSLADGALLVDDVLPLHRLLAHLGGRSTAIEALRPRAGAYTPATRMVPMDPTLRRLHEVVDALLRGNRRASHMEIRSAWEQRNNEPSSAFLPVPRPEAISRGLTDLHALGRVRLSAGKRRRVLAAT